MTETAFPGFPPEAMKFFRALKRNNKRDWFQPRKQTYEEKVKAPMYALVTALNESMAGFAPHYINAPEQAVYRIYRDTRFSPDKTPYKTHIAAIFPRRGFEKHTCAGLYFSVSPDEVEVAGGVYMPDRDSLAAIRHHLAEHHEAFREMAGARPLRTLMGELQGDQLTRAPKGFPPDHPAADLVRYKQWLFYVVLDPGMATTPALLQEVRKRFEVLVPFCDFLNTPLLAARKAQKTSILW